MLLVLLIQALFDTEQSEAGFRRNFFVSMYIFIVKYIEGGKAATYRVMIYIYAIMNVVAFWKVCFYFFSLECPLTLLTSVH